MLKYVVFLFSLVLRLAVQYLFMANEGVTEESRLEVEPFNATQEQNDYEVCTFLPSLFGSGCLLLSHLRFRGHYAKSSRTSASLISLVRRSQGCATRLGSGTPRRPSCVI